MSALAFDRPAWLLLVLAAPAIFAVAMRSLGDFSRLQLTLQATLRTLVARGRRRRARRAVAAPAGPRGLARRARRRVATA